MNWEPTQLGELITVKHGYAFKSQFFAGEGKYILLSPGNFQEKGGLKLKGDKEKYYTGDFPNEYLLKAGDLIVVMTDLVNTAPILGGSAIIPEDDKFLHNQRLGLVEIKNRGKIDKGFLYHLLNTREYRGQIRGSASGATVKHTAPERIYKCTLRVPKNLETQRRIASVLSLYDDLVETNLRRIKLLEESARLLYKEWFVRLQFPGYEHTSIVKGVPEGWKEKRLEDVSEINGVSISSSFEGSIEYIDISSVTPGSINATTQYDFADAPGRARRVVRHGDIIWSCVRPNRRSHAIIWKPSEHLIASTGFAVITPRHVPTTFLYQATTTESFVGYLENRARGVAYPAVLAKDFEDAEIVVPSRNLLHVYDDITRPMIDEIGNMRTQNNLLRQARNILLPKLMSGEISITT